MIKVLHGIGYTSFPAYSEKIRFFLDLTPGFQYYVKVQSGYSETFIPWVNLIDQAKLKNLIITIFTI